MNKYHIKPGKSCFCACMQNLLNSMGISYSEAEIFFLCDGMYCCFDTDALMAEHKNRLIFQTFDKLLQAFSKHTGMIFEKSERVYDIVEGDAVGRVLPLLAQVHAESLCYYKRIQNSEITVPVHSVLLYEICPEKVYVGDPFIVNEQGFADCYYGYVDKTDILPFIFKFFWPIQSVHRHFFSKETMIDSICRNITSFQRGNQRGSVLEGLPALYAFLNELSKLNPKSISERYLLVETAFIINGNMMFVNDYLVDLLTEYSSHEDESAYVLKNIVDTKHVWEAAYMQLLRVGYKKDANSYGLALDMIEQALYRQNQCLDKTVLFLTREHQ